MPDRPVTIANRHPRLRCNRHALSQVIWILDDAARGFRGGCPPGELSVVFLTDRALAKLHADFLDDPSVTDVITFEGDPTLGVAGEICVSADAALRQVGPRMAKALGRGKTRRRPRAALPPPSAAQESPASSSAVPAAFSTELLLYVVHGWLHLAGFDDLQPAKKRVMRRAETKALRLLHRAGLQLDWAQISL